METKLNKTLDRWLDRHRDELISHIAGLVNIKSVREPPAPGLPFGPGPARALDAALELARSFGLETRNGDYYYGLATLPGRGPGRLGVFAHLDVVPEGDGWSQDPYQCQNRDGWLVGRGVGDNKGPAVAALYALRFLREQGVALEKSVELFLGCAEESGMEDIARYTAEHDPPGFSFTPDVDFPVSYGEKGILEAVVEIPLSDPCLAELSGGLASNVVPAEAHALLRSPLPRTMETLSGLERITLTWEDGLLRVTAVGVSRHAAFPEGSSNAAAILCATLSKVEQLQENTRDTLSFAAASLADHYGASLGVPYEDAVSGRLTHTCGILRLADGLLSLDFNIRYPIHAPRAELKERFCSHFAGAGFSVARLHDNSPAFVSPERREVRTLTAICNDVLGTSLAPYTMGGGTYARKLPNAVGFGPGRSDRPAPYGGGHAPDECVSVDDLLAAVKIYVRALLELDGIPPV